MAIKSMVQWLIFTIASVRIHISRHAQLRSLVPQKHGLHAIALAMITQQPLAAAEYALQASVSCWQRQEDPNPHDQVW